MTDDIDTLCAGRRHMEAGGLSKTITAFATDLSGRGYAALTLQGYEFSARHLAAWMTLSSVAVNDLDEDAFERFARHRCRCGGSRARDRLSAKYVNRARRFAHFPGERGLAPRMLVQPDPVVLAPSVAAFADWLLRHRGLSERTISRHVRMISRLLPALGADPRAYDAALVRAVILSEGRRCSAAHLKTMAMALRGYLRFLAARSDCRPGLDYAVPTTPEWRLSALPRYLPQRDVDRLIEGCDLSQSQGIRVGQSCCCSPGWACGRMTSWR